MARGSARDEAGTAAWIAARLGDIGIEGEVEAYRGRTTFAWSFALLALVGLSRRLFVRLAALVALELDASGRFPLPIGSAEGANVVCRVPASRERKRTVVLMAHHDTQRTGLVWRPALHRRGAARRLRTRSIPAYLPPAAVVLAFGLRRLSLVLAGLSFEQALHKPVPGANDNATGVAALLALLEGYAASPLPDTEIVGAFVGCEESGMLGSRAFLQAHAFDPETTLVISLDTLGCGTSIVLEAEHTLLRHRYATRDLALVPPDVERWSIGGWTDALQAKLLGLRALSILSIGPEGTFTNYHHPSDTPDHVDFASVRSCIGAAQATVSAFDRG
ncbi:MAG: M28 family metallopeptidase [Solirubrobacteraceae bacterium]